jgi:UPF0755 protein
VPASAGAPGTAEAQPGPDTGPVVGPLGTADAADRRERRGAARRRARRRRRRLTLVALGLVAVLVVGVVAWYEVEAHPLGGNGPPVVVTIRNGEAGSTVLGALAARGVIGSALAFRLGELVHGTPTIRPGIYLFHQNQSFAAVRAILGGGPNVPTVTVVPGFTVSEVAAKLDTVGGRVGNQFRAALAQGTVTSPWAPAGTANPEGVLGTGTYRILPGETGTAVLAAMVARFDRQAAAAGATPAAAAAIGLTPYQLITVASIVEKEGYTPPSNFGPVARVIYNRLAAGMTLSMDATVLYSLGRDGGPVTAADLALDTPYNTYLHHGLTPTAICVPSAAALRAALDPPAGKWLYFVVVQKDGTEAFSETYAGQLSNEALAKSRGVG